MATTWDPANKSATATLSNGNLTVTDSSVVEENDCGRNTVAITTAQKKYWEEKLDLTDGAISSGPGISIITCDYTSGEWLGFRATSIGYYGTGEVFFNWNTLGTFIANGLNTFTTGDVICVAVDFAAGKIWFRVNNGNWNNSGTDNPATATGGIDFVTSRLGSGDVYPSFNVYRDGTGVLSKITGNFGATVTAFAIPSGFTTFDDALIPQAVM